MGKKWEKNYWKVQSFTQFPFLRRIIFVIIYNSLFGRLRNSKRLKILRTKVKKN